MLVLSAALSCVSRETPAGWQEQVQTGQLTVKLAPEAYSTKAIDARDGYFYNNVLVVITNEARQVIDLRYEEYGTPEQETDVNFEDLKVGTYHVYAYANIDHTDWQVAGRTIADIEKVLVGNRETGGAMLDEDRTLATLTPGAVPEYPERAMLLTGHSVVSVGSFRNIGHVDLLRPVVRLNVYLDNHTGFNVTLKDLSFSNFNPSCSFLFGHRDASGRPLVPEGASFGPLPDYDKSQPVTATHGSRMPVYSRLLYEGSSGEEYRMFATVEMELEGGGKSTQILSQMKPHLLKPSDVLAMEVGDAKRVMLVAPNTRNGGFFGVNGNSNLKKSATYNSEANYLAAATDILDDQSIRNYYIFTLTKTGLNTEGIGIYTLVNGTRNILRGNNIDRAYVEEGGLPTSSNYPISADFDGFLFRFRTDTWNHRDYLRANGGDTSPGYNDQSSKTEYLTEGNFQWAVYEVESAGATLRLIDNQTARVTELTHMLRNQELNIVMNVYYEESEHQFSFCVDNVYWTEGHQSSHVFK